MRVLSLGVAAVLGCVVMALPVATSASVSASATGGGAGAATRPAPCQAPTRSTTEYADRADAVFEGVVRETRVPEPDGRGRIVDPVTYVVDVQRVYKDDAVVTDTVRIESSYYRSACGLGELEPESPYFFFVRARQSGFRTSASLGSAPVTDRRRTEVEAALGAGEATRPEPTAADLVLEKVEADAPGELGRAVAPGAAITLVGMLGLAVVGLTRRRR